MMLGKPITLVDMESVVSRVSAEVLLFWVNIVPIQTGSISFKSLKTSGSRQMNLKLDRQWEIDICPSLRSFLLSLIGALNPLYKREFTPN